MGFWGITGKVLLAVGEIAVGCARETIGSSMKESKKRTARVSSAYKDGRISQEKHDKYMEAQAKYEESGERLKNILE